MSLKSENQALISAGLIACLLHAVIAAAWVSRWSWSVAASHPVISIQMAVTPPPESRPPEIVEPAKSQRELKTDVPTDLPAPPEPATTPVQTSISAPASEQPPLPGVEFVPAHLLDSKPVPLSTTFLSDLDKLSVGWMGKLVLDLWIDEQGRVVLVKQHAQDLPEQMQRQIAPILEQVRFVPGKMGNRVVPSVLRVELGFNPFFE